MNTDRPNDDEVRAEYRREDLQGGVRGKYLDQYRAGTNLVLLAPDARAAFSTDQSVNDALRSIMQHGPAERYGVDAIGRPMV